LNARLKIHQVPTRTGAIIRLNFRHAPTIQAK